jgi:hypothetical protein
MSNEPVETREQLVARLRQRLGREPTPSDIALALRYCDLAHQHAQFLDEDDGEG